MSFAFFFLSLFSFFFLLFLRLLICLGDNMTLKLFSEWDETLYALLLKSFTTKQLFMSADDFQLRAPLMNNLQV